MQDQAFEHLARRGAAGVPVLVDALLARSRTRGASDLHLEPTATALVARLRVDGVLENLTVLPGELAPNVVARCKV
jgi:type II secretory ATPase GspE/PulE/Tfp pilus assembly ATPase PilB-like protein